MTRRSACTTIAACAAHALLRLIQPPLTPTISARQVAGLVAAAIYASQCAQRLRAVNQTVTMDVPVICVDNGGTMDRGILYILTGLAAFWLGVAGLVLLFI